jgi:hypothetical protein
MFRPMKVHSQEVSCRMPALWYRVIKKSLWTWWLQYRNFQIIFNMSPASLQTFIDTRLTLTPPVNPNSNYVIMLSDWNCLKYFCVFLGWNPQVHRDFLITLYNVMSKCLRYCGEPPVCVRLALHVAQSPNNNTVSTPVYSTAYYNTRWCVTISPPSLGRACTLPQNSWWWTFMARRNT